MKRESDEETQAISQRKEIKFQLGGWKAQQSYCIKIL